MKKFIFSLVLLTQTFLSADQIDKPVVRISYKYWVGYDINHLLPHEKYTFIEVEENPDIVFFSSLFSETSGIERVWSKIRHHYKVHLLQDGRFVIPDIDVQAPTIFFLLENIAPDMSRCDFAFTSNYDDDVQNPRHYYFPIYRYFTPNVEKLAEPKHVNVDTIKAKTKFCNYIYSNKNASFRERFFDKLHRYKHVDSPGRSRNNMSNEYLNSVGKKTFQSTYKFTVAFENSSRSGYTTEKLPDAMMANSIPIYWGNPDVDQDFNTKSFLNYHEFEKEVMAEYPGFLFAIPGVKQIVMWFVQEKALDRLVEEVIALDQDDDLYLQKLQEPWVINEAQEQKLKLTSLQKKVRDAVEKALNLSRTGSKCF